MCQWMTGLGEVKGLLDLMVPRGGELERAGKMGGGLDGRETWNYYSCRG